MLPLRIVYECKFCENTHIENVLSSDEVYEIKKLYCNKCKKLMFVKIEEVKKPEFGQVR